MLSGLTADDFMLAALVSPGLLYAGVGAAAVPIIIHLLSKRRFRRVRWAAVDFLVAAHRQNRRRMRIEELILLALRCLAMFLIGLMLARWFVRPEALVAMLGRPAATERIIVLDDSFSMGLRDREMMVFDRAKSAVSQLVRWFRDEAPDDPLTVLLTSRPDKSFHGEANVGGTSLSAFDARLDALEPSYRGPNMSAALASVRGLLDARDSAVNATVYVVSDFQRIDWLSGDGEEKTPANSPAVVLKDWSEGERSLRVVLVDMGRDASSNLCVTAIEARQAQAVAGVNAQFVARINNFGTVESAPTLLQVYVGDATQPPVAVPAIGPNQSVDVPVEIVFAIEGSETLTFELKADALPVDNLRWQVVPVSRALRVLIVNGEPSPDPYNDEVFLLGVALRPEGPEFSGNEIVVVSENEFENADLGNFHVLLLANVNRISEETAERLSEYVTQGGGVAFFLGDQVDLDLYNRILYRQGRGLLPAKLNEVLVPSGNLPVVPFSQVNTAHPVMRGFAGTEVSFFDGVYIWQYVACEVDSADSSVPSRVLLSFADADQHPAIVERSFGNGRVVLVATTADKEWNNLADQPVFVVLANQLVQYLAKRADSGGDQLVGEPIQFQLDQARYQPQAILTPPTYPDEPASPISPEPDPDTGMPMIRWSNTARPGIYKFGLTGTNGEKNVEQIAVSLDPRESDLRRAQRSELLASMPDLAVEYITGGKFAVANKAEVRQELWPGLLILLVMVLMSEQALAWWFGSGRKVSVFRQGW